MVYDSEDAFVKEDTRSAPITAPLRHRGADKMKVRRRRRGLYDHIRIRPQCRKEGEFFNLERENSGLLMIK